MRASGVNVPDWMLSLKNGKKGRTRVIQRESISTDLNVDIKVVETSINFVDLTLIISEQT